MGARSVNKFARPSVTDLKRGRARLLLAWTVRLNSRRDVLVCRISVLTAALWRGDAAFPSIAVVIGLATSPQARVGVS